MTTLNARNVALNAELKENGGFECQTEEILWHLNAKLTNGSECQTEDMMALNV